MMNSLVTGEESRSLVNMSSKISCELAYVGLHLLYVYEHECEAKQPVLAGLT